MFFKADSALKSVGYSESDNRYLEGVIVEYIGNGDVSSIKNYELGLLNGVCLLFYDTGRLKAKYNYKDGKLNGKFITFYKNGLVKSIGTYTEGTYIGNKSKKELEQYGISKGVEVLIGNYWEYNENKTIKSVERYTGNFSLEEKEDGLGGYMTVIKFEKSPHQ